MRGRAQAGYQRARTRLVVATGLRTTKNLRERIERLEVGIAEERDMLERLDRQVAALEERLAGRRTRRSEG